MANTRDVLIIGGGPAGSSAGTFLAKKGLAVSLFEKDRFPRDHVGESLLPFCHNVFQELGVLDKMAATFVRKPGVKFISPDGEYETAWCFDRVIKDETYRSFQVDRGPFDQMLLENTREHGVEVFEETTVKDVRFDDESGTVALDVADSEGARRTYEGRFLIDASGRSTFMGNRNKSRRPNEDLDRTAVWTHFDGVELAGGLEDGVSLIIYIGGEKKGWAWCFPLGVDKVTVGIVTDNTYLKAEKKRLVDSEDWAEAFFWQEARESPFLRDLLAGARRIKPMFVNGDYSYFVDQKYAHSYALIGDAGRFIDPIFSSGVFLSMKSAKLVSDGIERMLANGNGRDLAPLQEAYGRIDGAYNFVHRMIKLFYNPHATSWAQAPRDVSDGAMITQRHADAVAAGHYMLAGDFFEKHEEYNGFFDLLENPRKFTHYKSFVIDRTTLQDKVCRRDPPDDNFPIK